MFYVTSPHLKNPAHFATLLSSLLHFPIYLQILVKCRKTENYMKKEKKKKKMLIRNLKKFFYALQAR